MLRAGRKARVILAQGALAALACGPALAQAWEWTVVPYVWGSDMSLDVSVGDREIFDSDVGFDDILDKLEMAAQIHFEGRHGKAGFFVDMTYLETKDTVTTAPRVVLPGGADIDTKLETLLAEVGGFYRLSGDETGLDLLYGVRATDLELDVDLTLPGPLARASAAEISQTYVDGFVGLRHTSALGQSWSLTLRGDVGAGDSDLVWNLSGLVGYHFGGSDQFAILGGYRHLVMEFEEGDVEVDLTMSGPALGFLARF